LQKCKSCKNIVPDGQDLVLGAMPFAVLYAMLGRIDFYTNNIPLAGGGSLEVFPNT